MDPLDNERLRLGINVPIADWGKAKSALQIAQSNEELVEMRVAQEKVNFEREIMIKVQQFDLVKEQVGIALRAYEIAQKRLDITQKHHPNDCGYYYVHPIRVVRKHPFHFRQLH